MKGRQGGSEGRKEGGQKKPTHLFVPEGYIQFNRDEKFFYSKIRNKVLKCESLCI